MKTPINLLFLLICCAAFGQIPSINPTSKSQVALEIPFNRVLTVTDDKSSKQALPEEKYEVLNRYYKQAYVTYFNDSIYDGSDVEVDSVILKKRSVKGVFEKDLSIRDYSFYIDSYNRQIDVYKAAIEELEDDREKDENRENIDLLTDSINLTKEKILLTREFVSDLVVKKNQKIGWFPSTKKSKDDFFQEFYSEDSKHTNYLNNLSLVFGSATVQSELLSDYAGPLRFSLGMVVNADTEKNEEGTDNTGGRIMEADENAEDAEDDLKRLLNGGGNFYFTTQFPVHSYSSPTFSEMARLNTNFASDIEGIGNDVEASNFKYGLNLSTYLSLTTDQKKFSFFVNADWGFIGGSDDFKEDFGLQKVWDKPALLGKAVIGISLDNKATISITTKSISNYESLRSEKIMVGIQLLN